MQTKEKAPEGAKSDQLLAMQGKDTAFLADSQTCPRRGFTFYRSFLIGIDALPDIYHAPLYEAIVKFALDFKEPDFSNYENAFIYKAVWANIRPVLEKDIKRFLNGFKGGAPVGNSNAKKQPKNNQRTTKEQPTPIYDERCKMEDERCKMREESPAPASFVIPSVEEVRSYAVELHAPEKEAVAFCDYYASSGWVMSGGRKMQDWRSSFRRWMNNADKYKKSSSASAKARTEIPHAQPGEFKDTLL